MGLAEGDSVVSGTLGFPAGLDPVSENYP
jgi:hypothetical protein